MYQVNLCIIVSVQVKLFTIQNQLFLGHHFFKCTCNSLYQKLRLLNLCKNKIEIGNKIYINF